METYNQVGRPRRPLLVGQRTYVEFAYRNKLKTQLDIAARIRVALPRVRRYLIELGLHRPFHHGAAAHTTSVNNAVEMYVEGVPVVEILQSTGIVVSELYKALHAENIPLRTKITNEL